MKRLTLEELQRLYMLRDAGKGVREIAINLGRSPSTVSRELRRKHGKRFWRLDSWSKARRSFEQRLKLRSVSRHRLRLKNAELRTKIMEMLEDEVSPKLISLRLEYKKYKHQISHQSIYNWIWYDAPEYKKYLLRKGIRGRRGGKRHRGKRVKITNKRSIEQRDTIVEGKVRYGDWEGDTVVSSKSKSCVFALRERKSRYIHFVKIDACTGANVYSACVQCFLDLPLALRKTLTFDNGPENSQHQRIEKRLGITTYFCHPYSSWERGSVENGNGFLRRYFPKGTNFNDVTAHQIRMVAVKHNHRPMECLGGATPYEVFMAQVKTEQRKAA